MKYRIEGVIGWEATARDLSEFLQNAAGADVEIVVSSPGGLVGEALDMFNQIRNYSGRVTAVLSGYAMSAASYIPMAASEVIAEDNAIMMIHNAQGLAYGDHNTMFKTGAIIKGMSAMIGNAYAKFTGKDKEEIAELMDGETWLFGEEIVDAGFANSLKEVSGDEKDAEAIKATAMFAFGEMVAKLTKSEPSMLYEDISRAAMALGSIGVKSPKNNKEGETMTLKELKEKFPDLVEAISNEATAGMDGKLKEAREEGRQEENQRIQDVNAQLVPGHEDLIASLAFDGKTTGPEAAVAVIQAEKKLRGEALAKIESESPAVVPVVNGDVENKPKYNSLEERCKAEFTAKEELRKEFGRVETYIAAEKADGKTI